MTNKELTALTDGFRKLAAEAISIAEALEDAERAEDMGDDNRSDEVTESEPAETEVEVTENKAEAKKYTKEQVRAILAAKSNAGYRKEMRDLVKSRAESFGDIDPEEYPALVAEAEGIGNG